jgi:hypothetical protein
MTNVIPFPKIKRRAKLSDGSPMTFDEIFDAMWGPNGPTTRLYRASWLKQHPNHDPESMPHIAGVAIVFEEGVVSD